MCFVFFYQEIDGKSFLLLTREALMEFKGIRLGPALKIIGYSAYLRAKSRILNIERISNRQTSMVPSSIHLKSASCNQMTSQERTNNSTVESFPNNAPSLLKRDEELQQVNLHKGECQTATNLTSKSVEAVEFKDVPGKHNIEDDIPLQKRKSNEQNQTSGDVTE